MRRVLSKFISNPMVRGALLAALSDITFLYAKAFINVISSKVNKFANGSKVPLLEDKGDPDGRTK